jgi:hypothetical protein
VVGPPSAEPLWDVSLISSLIEEVFGGDVASQESAASALDQVTRRQPELLARFSSRILDALESATASPVQAPLALVVSRLPLSDAEFERAADVLLATARSESERVKVAAIQALADLAGRDSGLKDRVLPVLRGFADDGPASIRVRCQRLLVLLEQTWPRTVRNPYLD